MKQLRTSSIEIYYLKMMKKSIRRVINNRASMIMDLNYIL